MATLHSVSNSRMVHVEQSGNKLLVIVKKQAAVVKKLKQSIDLNVLHIWR